MTIGQFAAVWLYGIAFPTTIVFAAWLLRMRIKQARKTNIKWWTLKIIPLVEGDIGQRVRRYSAIMLFVSVVYLVCVLALRFQRIAGGLY